MGNLRATLGYARSLGAGSGEIYTEKDGTRWTHDTLGNPIVIPPDKPAGELGIGEEPTYEKAAESMAPETRKFTDPSGKKVTMTETDIRPYLFDPTLIQREADLALISGKVPGSTYEKGGDVPGTGKMKPTEPIGTGLSTGEDWEDRPGPVEKKTFVDPEGGFTRLMPGVEGGEERVSEEETQKIKEASQRLDQAAGIVPPGGQELPEEGGHDYTKPGDRDDYRAFIVKKMGGDPTKINPHEEVVKMFPQDRVQQWYEDEWEEGRPLWSDLSSGEQEQVGKKARSDILAEFIKELGFKKVGLEEAMAEYDKNASAFFRALKTIQGIQATQIKEKRAGAKEEETALYRLNRSKASREKIQKALDESFSDEEKIRLEDQLKSADEEVRHFQTLVDQAKPKPKAGAEGKEKPVSTEPTWATEFAGDRKIIKSKEEGEKKYVLLMEDGKQVQWGFDPEAKKWKKMTPGKSNTGNVGDEQ